MTTDPTLPIENGTVLAVSCSKPGHSNIGASDITCAGGDNYSYSGGEPQCVEGNCKYIILISYVQ